MFEQIGQKGKQELKDNTPTGGANNFVSPAGIYTDEPMDSRKKKLLIIGTIVILVVVAVIFIILWSALKSRGEKDNVGDLSPVADDPARLEGVGLGEAGSTEGNESGVNGQTDVEYLSFADFYKQPAVEGREYAFANYELPLNVKVDVANYHEVSRKLNLEKKIEALNSNGFAVIDNPWEKEAPDFYALASTLDEKGIPLYISADFISYYYQNALKTSFKNIEEGIFYESLWQLNKTLFDIARSRYEAHLAQVGTQNDRVLEGERLEAAFFAVSLELLEPQNDQMDYENKFNTGKFSVQEQKTFSASVPSYLTDDVLKELELIRSAKESKKSPVLLYDRDYKKFVVPAEYKENARLHNFYLAAAWLNSIFPLNYRDDTCTECVLDHDDWRINFTAASLIAQDFADNQELKDEWARVYKTMSFFEGLRDAWDYVDYRDSAKKIFGDDYDIFTLFAETNSEAEANMEKLRQDLLTKTTLPMQGGAGLKTMDGYKIAGFQFLADFYWPNKYIFGSLSYPQVGVYQGAGIPGKTNVTACQYDGRFQRCQGSGQDILGLIYPAWRGENFLENANYSNYTGALAALRPQVHDAMSGQLNNYWSSLYIWDSYLNTPAEQLPSFCTTTAWQSQMADSALGAWTDMQLPADKFILLPQKDQSGLAVVGNVSDFAWVEPNLGFYDKLIAHNQMVLGMFTALGLNERSNLATNRLHDAGVQLEGLRAIAEKQAKGEALNTDDTQYVRDFAKLQTLDTAGEKTLSWRDGFLKTSLKEKIEVPKIIIVAHKSGDRIVFSAGPIFNYRESK